MEGSEHMGSLRTDPPPHDDRHEVVFETPGGYKPHGDPPVVTTEDRVTRMIVTSGSSFELFSGLIAIGAGIVGLVGYYPLSMAAIATIAVGFALLAQGATIAARWREAIHIVGSERREKLGITTEMFGGLAAIVIGVLALVYINPFVLLPAGALVIGLALLLGGPAQPDIAEVAPAATARRYQVTRNAVRTSSGVMVMAGVAAIVLGILALIGSAPVLVLSLVAMMCTAAALVLAGGTLVARFTKRFV
jgi:hypothetical protein